MLMVLVSFVREVFAGFFDSINIYRFWSALRVKEGLTPRVKDSVILNFCFLALAQLLIPTLLIPLVRRVIDINEILPSAIYYVLWIIPVYILSIIINISDFAKIAEEAHPPRGGSSGSLENVIAAKILSIGTRVCLNIEMVILSQIPFIGWPVSFIFGCWYWSFSCFEYHWIADNMDIENRVGYFENRWAYYFGFGICIELLFECLPPFIAAGVTGTYFCILIVCAALAPDREPFCFQFAIFEQALFITNYTCEEYGDIFWFGQRALHFYHTLKDPQNRSTIIVFSLIAIVVFSAIIKKMYT